MNSGFHRQALAIVALAALAGCATTSPRHVVQSREPLQRIELPQPPSNQDPMTLALAGEFALANADLDGAVASYVKAAQASDDPAIADAGDARRAGAANIGMPRRRPISAGRRCSRTIRVCGRRTPCSPSMTAT